MSEREIYFCVGARQGVHSAVWKVWVQGDEFYAAQVGLMAAYVKLSVHRSGICRLANVSTEIDIDWDRDSDPRVMQRWTIDEVGQTPWCECFSLMVPTIVVPQRFSTDRITSARQAGRIVWVEPAPVGWVTIVSFVRVRDPHAAISEFVDENHLAMGSLRLREGSRVWMIRHSLHLSWPELRTWQEILANTSVASNRPDGVRFAAASSPANFSHPVLREIALGRMNFVSNAPPGC